MRVTKTVREYIEKQVSAIFPKVSELPETIAYKKVIDEREEKWEKISAIAQAMLNEEVAKINATIPEGFHITEVEINRRTARDWHNPLYKAGREAEEKLRKDKEEAVSDIIVSLELGGTKDTLEKMLADLTAKVKGA